MIRVVQGTMLALVLVVVSVSASTAATTPTATFSWRGQDADKVAYGGPKADGKPDGHWTLTLDLGSATKTLNQIQVFKTANGLVWDATGATPVWTLGIYKGGKRINPDDEAISIELTGTVTLELYGAEPNPPGDGTGFGDGTGAEFRLFFTDGSTFVGNQTSKSVVTTPATIATTPTTTTGSTTPTVPKQPVSSGPSPDTHGTAPSSVDSLG